MILILVFIPYTDVCKHFILSIFPSPVTKNITNILLAAGGIRTHDPCNFRVPTSFIPRLPEALINCWII